MSLVLHPIEILSTAKMHLRGARMPTCLYNKEWLRRETLVLTVGTLFSPGFEGLCLF
jgi:hypothetical protein